MKMTLTTYLIADALKSDDNANWSRAGAMALANYFEELEADTGEEMELDIVAIRCDFSEYSSLQEWASEYFSDDKQAADALGLTMDMDGETPQEDDDEIDEKIRQHIQDNGQIIEFGGGIIVSSF